MRRMSRFIDWPLAIAIACVAGAAVHHTQANRPQGAPATSVATINLESVFNGLSERAAVDARMTALAESLDAQGAKQREEIDLLRQDLELLAPGTQQHDETSQRLARLGYQLQAYREFSVRKLELKKARALRQLYSNIKSAASELASDMGYDVVFVDDSIVDIPAESTEADTWRQISARRMLYTAPTIDITEPLITRMNNTYNLSQGG